MKIKTKYYSLFLLIPFTFLILLSVIFTPWQTSELEKITTTQGFDTQQIRGWMTMEDLINITKLSKELLYNISNLSLDIPSNTPLKEIKEYVPDFETDDVKIALDKYQEENIS